MRAIGGILGLVLVVAVGYYVYSIPFSRMENGVPPVQQIDLVGVRADLISLAQAERIFLATNGRYGTLEQLHSAGSISATGNSRRGYIYEVEVDGASHFRIVAKPRVPSGTEQPAFSIDESMQIISEDSKAASSP